MKPRKGILLAGGSSTRLLPATKASSKQLLPLYDKPLVYYPLSILMLAGITDILVITTPQDEESMKKVLGTGEQWGITLSYAVQPKPEGIAQAFIIAEQFLDGSPVALILGDNVFYGQHLTGLLDATSSIFGQTNTAAIFGYKVPNPDRFGVVEIDDDNRIVSLEEKPAQPKSNIAVVGLYFYPSDVCVKAKALSPSARGEYEIMDLSREYLKEDRLAFTALGRGAIWMDTGTPGSMYLASMYLYSLEQLTGQKVACLEEVALNKGLITPSQLADLIGGYSNNDYTRYLLNVLKECSGC